MKHDVSLSRRGLLFAAMALLASASGPTTALAEQRSRGRFRERARERAREQAQDGRRPYIQDGRREARVERPGYGPPEPERGGYEMRPPGGTRRGAFLPDYDRGALLNDYGRYRLRAPPRGYGWYRQGDTYLLVDEFTGQVFDVVR